MRLDVIRSFLVKHGYGEQRQPENSPLGLSDWTTDRRVKFSLDVYSRLPNTKLPER